MVEVLVRSLEAADIVWVRQWIIEHWGDELMVLRGELLRPHEFPGFAAFDGAAQVGLVTYRITELGCEVLSLDSLRERSGVGTALIEAVAAAARAAGCSCVYMITTNDNMNALRFYQKRGFVLAGLRPNAMEHSRALKPSIPLIGMDGIPLRDEIELEMAI